MQPTLREVDVSIMCTHAEHVGNHGHTQVLNGKGREGATTWTMSGVHRQREKARCSTHTHTLTHTHTHRHRHTRALRYAENDACCSASSAAGTRVATVAPLMRLGMGCPGCGDTVPQLHGRWHPGSVSDRRRRSCCVQAARDTHLRHSDYASPRSQLPRHMHGTPCAIQCTNPHWRLDSDLQFTSATLYRQAMEAFCPNAMRMQQNLSLYPRTSTNTHTHTHIHVYIYIYILYIYTRACKRKSLHI